MHEKSAAVCLRSAATAAAAAAADALPRIRASAALAALTVLATVTLSARPILASPLEEKASRGPASMKPIESPYQACKGITLVHRQDDPGNENCPDCGNRVQLVPETGILIAGVQPRDIAGAMTLTTRIVEKSIAYLNQNISFLESRVACYAKDAPSSAECEAVRAEISGFLAKAVPELRKEYALVRADVDIENLRIFDRQPDGFLNRRMSGYGFGPQKASYDRLEGEELEQARKTYLQERSAIDAEIDLGVEAMKARPRGSFGDAMKEARYRQHSLTQKLGQMRERHRHAYLETFRKLNSPLLVYVSRVNPAREDLEKALKILLANARGERAKAVGARDSKKLEFARLYERDADGNFSFSIAKFRRGLLGGERDLLHYMMYRPLVEEVLREDPALCGVATGLSNHLFNKELQTSLGIMAVTLPALIAAAPLAGAALTASTGVALTAGEIGSFMGAAMGLGFVSFSASEVREARRQAFNRTGLGDRETQSMDSVAEKERDFAFNLALHPLDWIGVGGASRTMYVTLVKKFIKTDSGAVLAAIRVGDRGAIATANRAINDGVAAQVEALVSEKGGRPLGIDDRRWLEELGAEMQRKGMLGRAATPEAAEADFRNYVEVGSAIFERPLTPQVRQELVATAKAALRQLDPAKLDVNERTFITRMLAGFLGFQAGNRVEAPIEAEVLALKFLEELEKMKTSGNHTPPSYEQAFGRILRAARLESPPRRALAIPDRIPAAATGEIRSDFKDELALLTGEDRELAERAVYAMETELKLPKTSIKRKLEDIVGRCGMGK